MNNKMIRFIFIMMAIWVMAASPVYAADKPEIEAKSAILVEPETGKVLYELNADLKVYPASMTKILTALVMVDYIDMDEIIVTGSEVYNVPYDSSRAGHVSGESIKGINLLRALMLPSGNETGCVVAVHVAKMVSGDENLSYNEYETIFAGLLNEKARELGATHSHFVNAHGYHHEDHYTSARDMAIICKAAMENPHIAAIAAETSYIGNGVGTDNTDEMKTVQYEWHTTNKLIDPNSNYYYPHAYGIKTGFTKEAGNCLASIAEKEDEKLIAIIFGSEDILRFEDSAKLFDYGFDNYSYRYVQQDGAIMDTVGLHNPKLGGPNTLDVKAAGEFKGFCSEEEFNALEKVLVYNESKIYTEPEEENSDTENNEDVSLQNSVESETSNLRFNLPIKEGEVLGHVSYYFDGEEIFTGNLISTGSVDERTYKTDMEYYIELVKENMFTLKAIPFWLAAIFIIVVIIAMIRALIIRRRRKSRYHIHYKRRY